MKRAGAYQTRDNLIFCSNAQTTEGVWLSVPPYIHKKISDSDEEIVLAIKEVLDATQTAMPHPKLNEWGIIRDNHLKGLGLKSMSVLHNKADYCLIVEQEEEIKFSPTKNAGIKGGYEFLPEIDISISRKSSPRQIINALKEALYLSTNLKAR